MGNMSRKYIILCLASVALLAYNLPAQHNCLDCHSQSDFIGENPDGSERSLFVDAAMFRASAHGDFSCTDCHVDAVGDPHPERLAAVNCADCHDAATMGFQQGAHGRVHGNGKAAIACSSCHTAHEIKSAADPQSATHPINQPKTCGACHLDNSVTHGRAATVDRPVERYSLGVHGRALAEGNDAAPSCSACHEPHRSLPKSDPRSMIHRTNISATCGACHADIAAEYDASVHGVGLRRGEFMSATCITCHDAHDVRSSTDLASPTHPLNAPDQLCAPCHGAERLNRRFGLTDKVFQSYKDSYHGLAATRGSTIAASCVSCHGVHNIRSKNDPQSTVHPANVRSTCARCHPYAGEAFALSYTHTDVKSLGFRISAVVRSIYLYLIVLIIGGMVVHNLIIWAAHVRAKAKLLQKSATIKRFGKAWVFQHVVIFISFTLLVITGFALKYPHAGWARLLTGFGMTEAIRGGLHRAAAVALLLAGLHHLYCLFFVKTWRGELAQLAPKRVDFLHFYENMRYHLGLTLSQPHFDRFSYIEKVEYWALVWGTAVMALTGFVLWFPALATRVMPSWAVKVAETVHFYEAVLATLAVLLYHMFFAVFHPQDYPINLTGFTGKISEEEAKAKYPRWYNNLKEGKSEGTNDQA